MLKKAITLLISIVLISMLFSTAIIAYAKTLELEINSNEMRIDGSGQSINNQDEVTPIQENGAVYLPLRAIVEELFGKWAISWESPYVIINDAKYQPSWNLGNDMYLNGDWGRTLVTAEWLEEYLRGSYDVIISGTQITIDEVEIVSETDEQYTVSFVSNGGSEIESQVISSGYRVNIPVVPVKDDYDFAGWYKDVSLTNVWNFVTDKVTSDITLYAMWAERADEEPIDSPDDSEEASDESAVTPDTPETTSDESATAATQFRVSYDANGGTGNTPESQTVDSGKTITIASSTLTKTGYTFDGWSTSQSGTPQYQPGNSFTPTENVTLYAVWKSASSETNPDSDDISLLVSKLRASSVFGKYTDEQILHIAKYMKNHLAENYLSSKHNDFPKFALDDIEVIETIFNDFKKEKGLK